MKNEGWIKLYRKIWDNPISKKPMYLIVFLFIISHANYQDNEVIINNKKTLIKRGQWLSSIRYLAEYFKISVGTAFNIIKFLKVEHYIEHYGNGRYSLFTIMNYDLYNQPVEHNSNLEITLNKLRVEQDNNNKNIKNNNNNSATLPLGKLRCPLELKKTYKELIGKYPNGHKECLEYIKDVEEVDKKHKFVNWPKQIACLHKILRAGFTFEDTNTAINKLQKNNFYIENGWDFANVAQQLERK